MFQLFQEVAQITDPKILDTKLADYQTRTSDLWDQLMGLELQLVDQLEVSYLLWTVIRYPQS